MRKIKSKDFVEKIILIFMSLLVLFFYYNKIYCSKLIAYLTLFIDIYSMIKFKKNPMIFLILLCFFVFDYSVIVSKYISYTNDMISVYKYFLSNNQIMFIGISSVFLFHVSFLIFCNPKNVEENNLFCLKSNDIVEKNHEYVSIVITLITIFIILDYYVLHIIVHSRTIYEYTIVLFVIACYYSNGKVSKYLIFLTILASFVANSIDGGRVLTLQPIIAYILYFYKNNITTKRIFLITIVGIVVFTLLGVYGDLLVQNKVSTFSIRNVINLFLERKLSIDTSISSFGTSLTFLSLTDMLGIKFRIVNFFQFVTKYTIFGSLSNYAVLTDISRKYYVHYAGSYLPLCFYFWLGWIGIFLIGFIIAKYTSLSTNILKKNSGLKSVLFVYFVSTLPRWYLYYPTPLFRGILITTIVFLIIDKLLKKKV